MRASFAPRWTSLVAVLGAGLLLSACGGGSTAPAMVPAPATALSLSGTAATGSALANVPVLVKCVGATTSTMTGADGSYSAKLQGAQLPCALRITAADGVKLHSIAQGTGTELIANITPLTELLLTRAAHQEAVAYFDGFATAKLVTLEALRAAQGELQVFLNGTVDTSAVKDFIAGPLIATVPGKPSTDMHDKLLDTLGERVTPARFAQFLRTLASNGPLPDPLAFVPQLTLRIPQIALGVGQTAILVADLNYPPNVRYIRPPMTWTVVEDNGGSVTVDGVYTAPSTPGTYHVKASRDDYANISATMTIMVAQESPIKELPFVPGLSVGPAGTDAALMPGQMRQFTANINYPPGVFYVRQPTSWTVVEADGGSITMDGFYTAPSKVGTYHLTVTRDDFKDKSITVPVKVGSYQTFPLVVNTQDFTPNRFPPEQITMRDADALLAWKKGHDWLTVFDLPETPDFDRFMFVYVDLGARTPCFHTRLLDVAPVGGKLQVLIEDTPFGPGSHCIASFVPGPHWLIMVPKSDLPVSVVVRQ